MADSARPVEINGLVFASTSDGHLLESEVRAHVEALQRENADLRARVEHVTSLERLAQSTVMKADDLAAEIETEARRRVDEMTLACETEITERRRQFEVESSAQQAAAQARVAQLQAALEGTLQTLGRALQAAGAPALEMPAASDPAWSPEVATPPTPAPVVDTDAQANGAVGAAAADAPAADEPQTHFGFDSGLAPEEPASAAVAPEEEPAAEAVVASAVEPLSEADFAALPSESPAADEAEAFAPTDTGWAEHDVAAADEPANPADVEPEMPPDGDGAHLEPLADRSGGGTFELTRQSRPAMEPTPIRPSVADLAGEDAPEEASVEPAPVALSRTGPATLEIDMRPVKSFADLARVTKLLGRIAPGAQPVDLNLPQHRALFSVRGKDPQALAAQLQEALPEARVVEREEGLDVLLEGEE